ncbi:efflux RND transporter periplasmic adaptor subunit [Pseudomonas sp. NPDC007930]|uniref:HlyD family secretion protein n=1 Tax=Pseudomonas sp. NPDC007930 TaxID=3364417 RepID=UPI0036E0B860
MLLKPPYRYAIPALLVAAVLGVGLWHLVGPAGPEQTTDDAYVQADFTWVAARLAGTVESVQVADNQPVQAGQLLATLDPRDWRAQAASAQAQLGAAEARQATAEAALLRQASLVAQARAAAQADQAQVALAEQDLARYQHLAADGAGTLQRLQQARAALPLAQAREAEHRAALRASEQQTALLQAEQRAAQAGLEQAQANLEQARLNLSYTELRAPIAGTVGRRALRVGAYVKPGEPLLAVVPLGQAYVVANFQENQLTAVQPGQPVRIEVDSFPGTTLNGHVHSLAPATGVTFAAVAPDNATGNFTKVVQRLPVKVLLDPGQPLAGRLKVGMSVQATLDTRAVTATVGSR